MATYPRIWSLEDMIRFLAPEYLDHAAALGYIHARLEAGIEYDRPELVNIVMDNLEGLGSILVGAAIQRQVLDLQDVLATADQIEIRTRLHVLHRSITAELRQSKFFMIPRERSNFYSDEPSFAEQRISAAFNDNDLARDMAAASRCIALEEWTGSVFHMMRVAEHGLRFMARRLKIGMAEEVEYAVWKNVIDQIEKEIDALRNSMTRGPVKSETLRVYSEAASQFWYFKDAWRNHVMHTRVFYDDRAALNVFNSTIGLMEALAAVATADDSPDSGSALG